MPRADRGLLADRASQLGELPSGFLVGAVLLLETMELRRLAANPLLNAMAMGSWPLLTRRLRVESVMLILPCILRFARSRPECHGSDRGTNYSKR